MTSYQLASYPEGIHASSDAVYPRSASEAIVVEGETKYRQLPCRTFISVGTCPYRERCVYLHDPRCLFRNAKTKSRRKNQDDTVLDTLFWPAMPVQTISSKLDNQRQPHVVQHYQVPPPRNDLYHRHDEAVYSIWSHFVDFCMANAESQQLPVRNGETAPVFSAPDLPINAYTKLPRLPIFRLLSRGSRHGGLEILREELEQSGDYLSPSSSSSHQDYAAKAILRGIINGDFHVATHLTAHSSGYHQAVPMKTPPSSAGGMRDMLHPLQVDHHQRKADGSISSPNSVSQLPPTVPGQEVSGGGRMADRSCHEGADRGSEYLSPSSALPFPPAVASTTATTAHPKIVTDHLYFTSLQESLPLPLPSVISNFPYSLLGH